MVKKQSDAAIAAFLANGGKVTSCPTANADAIPLRRLHRLAEQAAEQGQPVNVLARRNGERVDPAAADRRTARESERDYQDMCRMERQSEQAAAMGGMCVGFDEYGDAVSRADLDYRPRRRVRRRRSR